MTTINWEKLVNGNPPMKIKFFQPYGVILYLLLTHDDCFLSNDSLQELDDEMRDTINDLKEQFENVHYELVTCHERFDEIMHKLESRNKSAPST